MQMLDMNKKSQTLGAVYTLYPVPILKQETPSNANYESRDKSKNLSRISFTHRHYT